MLARLSKKDLKNRRESVEGENIPKEDGKCVEKQASDTVWHDSKEMCCSDLPGMGTVEITLR